MLQTMNHAGRSYRLAAAAMLAIALGTPAYADVKIESNVKTSGIGGIGAMQGTTVQLIKGDKSKHLGTMQFNSGFLRAVARGAGGDTQDIVRLDRDVMYRINQKDRTYQEISLAQMRAEMEKMTAKMAEAGRGRSPESDPNVRMLPPEIDVKRPGEKKTINGFDCEHVIVDMRLPFENTKTGEKGAMKMVSDMWIAPVSRAQQEMTEFGRLYAQKLGVDAQAQAYAALMGPQGARFGSGMKDMAKKMQDLNGYPIVTTISMGAEGTGSPQQSAAPPSEQPQPQGGRPGLGKLGGLGGMFGKKKKPEEQPPSEAPPAAAVAPGSLMTITTEVKSIAFDSIPDAEFEVPAGFKKVEARSSEK